MIAQANIAFNADKGTLRGMHFQYPPAAETKLVRATRGAILDIIVDLRPGEPDIPRARRGRADSRTTTGRSTCRSVSPTATRCSRTTPRRRYQVGEFYTPDMEGGLRYDDPRLGLEWPLPVAEMSEKDDGWKLLDDVEAELKERMSV